MTDAVGPDRNRLHDLVKLTWDEAQTEGADPTSVTADDIVAAGPYSAEQIAEHLQTEQESTYKIARDGDQITVLEVQQ